MPPQPIVTARNGRSFACVPAAVTVFIINEQEQILLLSRPGSGGWEVINGALEAGETVLAGALRETREEAGPLVRVRPLGTVHVSSFHYDPAVRYMLSIAYLLAYEGGPVQPGDDMQGSAYRWWSLVELAGDEVKLLMPPDQKWLVARAVELYRLWQPRPQPDLQPDLG